MEDLEEKISQLNKLLESLNVFDEKLYEVRENDIESEKSEDEHIIYDYSSNDEKDPFQDNIEYPIKIEDETESSTIPRKTTRIDDRIDLHQSVYFAELRTYLVRLA